MSRPGIGVLSLVVVMLVAACGDGGPPPERVDPDEVAAREQKAQGRAAFDAAGCGKCHVVDPSPAVLEGPDLTYYAQRPVSGSGAVNYRLNPAKSGSDGHATIADGSRRQLVSRYLGIHCKLEGYVPPPRDAGGGASVKCPVTGLRIDPKKPGAWRQYSGANYYFPDEVTAQKFDLDPGHFAK